MTNISRPVAPIGAGGRTGQAQPHNISEAAFFFHCANEIDQKEHGIILNF